MTLNIDSGGSGPIETGIRGYIPIPMSGLITGWILFTNPEPGMGNTFSVENDYYQPGFVYSLCTMSVSDTTRYNSDTLLSDNGITTGDVLQFTVTGSNTTVSQVGITLILSPQYVPPYEPY